MRSVLKRPYHCDLQCYVLSNLKGSDKLSNYLHAVFLQLLSQSLSIACHINYGSQLCTHIALRKFRASLSVKVKNSTSKNKPIHVFATNSNKTIPAINVTYICIFDDHHCGIACMQVDLNDDCSGKGDASQKG